MKYIISGEQAKQMEEIINDRIEGELNSIRTESEDWGLGEMDEIEEINSIEKIVIDRIKFKKGIKVYVNLYVNSDRDEFYNVISTISDGISTWIPDVELKINKIVRI